MRVTQEQLAEYRTQHGTVIHIRGKADAWELLLRKPKRMEWKRIRAMMHNPAQVADANETLVRTCAVHPTKDALDALLEEYPGIPEAVGGNKELAQAVGLSTEDEEK